MKHASKVDRTFRYTSAANTNIAATIARERKRIAELPIEQQTKPANVLTIKRKP